MLVSDYVGIIDDLVDDRLFELELRRVTPHNHLVSIIEFGRDGILRFRGDLGDGVAHRIR